MLGLAFAAPVVVVVVFAVVNLAELVVILSPRRKRPHFSIQSETAKQKKGQFKPRMLSF